MQEPPEFKMISNFLHIWEIFKKKLISIELDQGWKNFSCCKTSLSYLKPNKSALKNIYLDSFQNIYLYNFVKNNKNILTK